MCSVLQPDLPHAYVCAESYIFDVTEWFNCQVIQIFLNKKSDLLFFCTNICFFCMKGHHYYFVTLSVVCKHIQRCKNSGSALFAERSFSFLEHESRQRSSGYVIWYLRICFSREWDARRTLTRQPSMSMPTWQSRAVARRVPQRRGLVRPQVV